MRRPFLQLALALVVLACGRDWELPAPPGPSTGFCSRDADCPYGLCEEGRCNALICEHDGHCQFGQCIEGRCAAGTCTSHSQCGVGACIDGECDPFRCDHPAACGPNAICEGATDDELGHCIPDPGDVPDLLGDPAALTMHDNLESAWAFVRARHPDADLVQILGLGLSADGTVDVTETYGRWWMYAFLEADSDPHRWVTIIVTFNLNAPAVHYDPDAGNVSLTRPIPEAEWRDFLDSTTLTAEALARGCAPPVGESGDSLSYERAETGPEFRWWTQAGEGIFGDPTTGDVTVDGCEP